MKSDNLIVQEIFGMIRLKENVELISQLNVVDINLININKQNMLHEAIAYSNNEILPILVTKKIQLNQQDINGKTPVFYAVEHKNIIALKLLINTGADIDLVDNFGNNPLWRSVFDARGNYGIVTILREAGANTYNVNHHGKSPLDFAKQIGDITLEKILVG